MAQTQIFRGTARRIVRESNRTEYHYHNTAVVTAWDDGRIVLCTGGWRTTTTKTAMNQAAKQFGLGFGVCQEKGEWYVLLANPAYPQGDYWLPYRLKMDDSSIEFTPPMRTKAVAA